MYICIVLNLEFMRDLHCVSFNTMSICMILNPQIDVIANIFTIKISYSFSINLSKESDISL